MSSPMLSGGGPKGSRCRKYGRSRVGIRTCRKYSKRRSCRRSRRSRRCSKRSKKACSSKKGKGWKGAGYKLTMEELRKIVTTCKDYETEMGAAEVTEIKGRLSRKYGVAAAGSLKDMVVQIFKDQATSRYGATAADPKPHGEENFKRDLAGGRRRRSRSCSRRRRSRRCSRR